MAGMGRSGAGILRKAEAPPEARALLEEVQDTLGLPWLPFPWAAYARRPAVLKLFWRGLKELSANDLFLRESLALAATAHLGVAAWYRPAGGVHLSGSSGEPTLARELDAFEYGFPQLLIQQTALARLLGGHGVGGAGKAVARRPSPFRHPEIDYPEWEELEPSVQELVRHVRQAWSLPQAVPEALALAKWPAFLEPAWDDLKSWRLRPEYRALKRRLADLGEEALERLRPPAALPAEELRRALESAGEWPAGADRLKDQVQSFILILPGLIVDNAILRAASAAWRPKPVKGHP